LKHSQENGNTDKTFYILSIAIFISMIGGIAFPYVGIIFEPYLLIWLGLLLFFNLIRMDIGDILSTFAKPKILIIFTIVKLIVIPISLYFIINHVICPKISTDTMLSIFLLSGISTGLGSPFVINFVGGKLPIVVAIVITTSFAVPFVLPALVYVLFKSQFSIPIINMILLLSSALFIPLAAGYFMKKYAPKITKIIDQKALVFSIVFIFFMNFGVFAKYSNYFFFNLDFVFKNIIIAFLLFAVYGFIGYSIARLLGMNKHERMSIFIAMTYVNNMLVIVFAQQFFNMQIAALSAFFNIPYYTGILILKKFVERG
jgi:bile acid:Na+ symporter, BASS family